MIKSLTLGSLFDGIGAFPLAGKHAGITPIWASEIEPFPIRVTSKRIPEMKYYGDIRNLCGDELEPVDIITMGSPCVNLSVAGKREGIHSGQSSLFFEAVRVIKEMRVSTNGTHPRWIAWENVQSALSCTGGNAFREILESLVRIKEPKANVPMSETGKWLPAGEIMGDHYSIAWRVLDAASGFGVPQRRRRIFLVVDLDGHRAGAVLFESEGLSGYTPQGQQARQGNTGGAAAGVGTRGSDDGGAVAFEPGLLRRMGRHMWQETAGTIRADAGDNAMAVAMLHTPKAYSIGSDQSKGMLSDNPRMSIYQADISRTLDCTGTSAACNQDGITVVAPVYAVGRAAYSQGASSDFNISVKKEQAQTLTGEGPGAVVVPDGAEYIARRLVPSECCALMGFPQGWTENLGTDAPTDDEVNEWIGVFQAWYRAQGKETWTPGPNRIRKWLHDPQTDSAEYKAYGNSLVVPCAAFVLAGIVWAEEMEG